MNFTELLHKIVEKQDLNTSEARFGLQQIIDGAVTDIEAGAFLFGLRAKGETISELTTFVQTMRDAMIKVEVDTTSAIDLCGTGGDHSGYFNISTAAMFVVAGAGIPVLKHGNRSVSSQTGSADVLEALGIKVDLNKIQVERVFEKTGMVFMFAPFFHPAMKNIVPVRKALKMRTFFNILGPLLNPAGVERQIIGAFNKETASTMAQILAELNAEKAITVFAHQGLDEVSILSETDTNFVSKGKVLHSTPFDPKDLGLIYTDDSGLKGGDKHFNANRIKSILDNENHGIATDMVALNAAFAIQVSKSELSIQECFSLAKESIQSGKAKKSLLTYIKATQEV